MTYVPHMRVSCLGTLRGGEIFSYSFAIAEVDANGAIPSFQDIATGNATVWDDIAQDVADYHPMSGASSAAVLKTVKIASIGADGKYTEAPIERTVGGVNGVPGLETPKYPNQVALAVTLHSAGDLGRVKGRFYVPSPGYATETDARISEANRDIAETRAGMLVDAINNQPGLDVLNLRVVIASQGRRNADGTVKIPPKNHTVEAVSVGRTLDTIRSRRNKVTELRGTVTSVS